MTDTPLPTSEVPAVPEGYPGPAQDGSPPALSRAGERSIELLHGVEMAVTVELGRTRMTMRDLLALGPGSVVELDRSVGAPVDVLVNTTIVARGEVVVIDDELGVRITEIAGPADEPRHA